MAALSASSSLGLLAHEIRPGRVTRQVPPAWLLVLCQCRQVCLLMSSDWEELPARSLLRGCTCCVNSLDLCPRTWYLNFVMQPNAFGLAVNILPTFLVRIFHRDNKHLTAPPKYHHPAVCTSLIRVVHRALLTLQIVRCISHRQARGCSAVQ